MTIEGIESNTCCGTHVASTAHLQSVKLLRAEKSPAAKDNTRVWFVAGNRVLKMTGDLYKTSCQLTRVLTSGSSEHTERVSEIVQNQKDLNRSMKQLLRSHAKLSAHLAHHPDFAHTNTCLLYTSPSPRDMRRSRMPSSA